MNPYMLRICFYYLPIKSYVSVRNWQIQWRWPSHWIQWVWRLQCQRFGTVTIHFIKPGLFIQLVLILSTKYFGIDSTLWSRWHIGKEMLLSLSIAPKASLISISVFHKQNQRHISTVKISGRRTYIHSRAKQTRFFLLEKKVFWEVDWPNNAIFEDLVSQSSDLSLFGPYWSLIFSEFQGILFIIVAICVSDYLCAMNF